MIYNFTEMKKRNESMEEELQALKKNYQKPQMSNNQLDKLRKRMEEANMENRRDKRKKKMIQATAAAAAIVGAFLILPNTSASIAHAMEQIPIIGQLVEVVTFRDYTYETDRNMADIEVPEIKLDDQAAEGEVKENLERSTEEINAEIQKITSELIAEFEANLEYEEGYQDVIVQSEILATEEEYFTLKLICCYCSHVGLTERNRWYRLFSVGAIGFFIQISAIPCQIN